MADVSFTTGPSSSLFWQGGALCRLHCTNTKLFVHGENKLYPFPPFLFLFTYSFVVVVFLFALIQAQGNNLKGLNIDVSTLPIDLKNASVQANWTTLQHHSLI